ncbi:MAG: molybdopterin molybdenumtransferase MoeA [Candidatus Nephthysia bennettiae]|uniref:Molybdopterin molybdenumtransferase n=1 Tax=Candidatus Nephthysia bennettiae TaxID=3127016 RepID=A0A934K4P0_9BACT|nr:molybdopterin molybdotransferase MoeA [Candidatus Dormibacteraeota bacterium]MBJ7611818.1 molybdopterin molybdotransferase MoeA [Candidatus Dormibacteraeota bacterium]PZR99445.1 MAG: molybdopterin molybdenumtransferase MoeA [Candidatus Dormibacteraeota bacterium]
MRASTYPLVEAGEAAALVLERTPVLPGEEVHLAEAVGRVLVSDLVARGDLPPFPSSAVDGYAIRAADAGARLRVAGESAAGRPFEGALPAGAAAMILTGGVVPVGADTVVMVEEVEAGDGWVVVPAGFPAGRNFHRPGDDLRRGDLVVRRGLALGPAELGLAAAIGAARLQVHRRPRVALMSTGDELVEAGQTPGPGQVVDSNRWALLAALQEAGASVTQLGAAPDRPEPLAQLVTDALASHDVLLTSGGVSVGTHDLVKPLLERLGEVHLGRVKLKPGKPFTFATLPAGRVAFGLPGFPVSSLVTFEVFVRPALRKMQGYTQLQRPTLPVRLGYDARAPGDRTEYQRVTLAREGAELVARSTGSQSSSRLLSLAGANALVRVPPGEEGIPAGGRVEAVILSLPA